MRDKPAFTEKHIRVACHVLDVAHDHFEAQNGKLKPRQVARVQKVWEQLAQWLVKFEDGPAVMFQPEARLQQLHKLEGIASNLLFMAQSNHRIIWADSREALNYRPDLH